MEEKSEVSETIVVNSTKESIILFKESVLWADIQRELNSWLEGFRREKDAIVDDAANDNPSTASVLLHLGDINGRQKAVAYLLQLPDMFLDLKQTKEVSNE